MPGSPKQQPQDDELTKGLSKEDSQLLIKYYGQGQYDEILRQGPNAIGFALDVAKEAEVEEDPGHPPSDRSQDANGSDSQNDLEGNPDGSASSVFTGACMEIGSASGEPQTDREQKELLSMIDKAKSARLWDTFWDKTRSSESDHKDDSDQDLPSENSAAGFTSIASAGGGSFNK